MGATCCTWEPTPAQKEQWKRQAEKRARRESYRHRAQANQARGRRFERRICAGFHLYGIRAELVDESDGFTKGWDIYLPSLPKTVVQCKATKTKAALLRGLEEARQHNPDALFWVCVHSWRRTGKKPEIRVAYSSRPSGPPSITDWPSFFKVLARAEEKGEYPNA